MLLVTFKFSNFKLCVVPQVDAYLSSVVTVTEDILSYWESRRETWKGLSKVACDVLGIPAASTSPERCFSVAGRTLDDRRNLLSQILLMEFSFTWTEVTLYK